MSHDQHPDPVAEEVAALLGGPIQATDPGVRSVAGLLRQQRRQRDAAIARTTQLCLEKDELRKQLDLRLSEMEVLRTDECQSRSRAARLEARERERRGAHRRASDAENERLRTLVEAAARHPGQEGQFDSEDAMRAHAVAISLLRRAKVGVG